jgi:hypothetical protein
MLLGGCQVLLHGDMYLLSRGWLQDVHAVDFLLRVSRTDRHGGGVVVCRLRDN